MKNAKTDLAKKILATALLLCCFLITASAQKTTLTLVNGKASLKRNFQPKRKSDAHFYSVKLRAGQTVAIKITSNSVFLAEDDECAVYFQLFDEAGKEVFIGDSMVGIDSWKGEIKETGNYQIKITMQCISSFTTQQLRQKKPNFNYSLNVQTK